jgi:hypothetical protein
MGSALQLVTELGELVTAGHLAGELVEGDFGALLVQHGLAELEDDEVVADQVGVVRVVGDEDHAEAGIPSAAVYFITTPDCFTPSAAVGWSRISNRAPK